MDPNMDPNMDPTILVHLVKTCSNMLTSWWPHDLQQIPLACQVSSPLSSRSASAAVCFSKPMRRTEGILRRGQKGATTSGYSSKSMGKSAFRYFDRFYLYLFFWLKASCFPLLFFFLVFCFVFSAGVAISFCFVISLFVVCSIRNLLLQYIILWVFPFVVVLRPKNHRISQLLWFSCLNVAGRKRRSSSTTTVLYN